MVDLMMGLNNFSISLEEILKSFTDGESDIPKELSFIDLLPIEPDDEVQPLDSGDTEDIVEKKLTLNDISKHIIELQNSISQKLDISNGFLEDQKHTLKLFKNQNIILDNLPIGLDLLYPQQFDESNSKPIESSSIVEKLFEYFSSFKKSQIGDLKLPKLQIDFDLDYLKKSIQEGIKFPIEYQNTLYYTNLIEKNLRSNIEIPNLSESKNFTNLKDIPNIEVVVNYDTSVNKPIDIPQKIVIPVIYDEISNLKEIDKNPIIIPVKFEKIYEREISNTKSIENESFTTKNYLFENNINYEYIASKQTIPNLNTNTEQIRSFYDIQNPIEYQKTISDIGIEKQYQDSDKILDLIDYKSLFNLNKNSNPNVTKQILEPINRYNINFSEFPYPNNGVSANNNQQQPTIIQVISAIPELSSNLKSINLENMDFEKISNINYNINNDSTSEGFLKKFESIQGNIQNMIEFIYDLPKNNLSMELKEGFQTRTLNFNEITNEIISNTNLNNIEKINKIPNPEVLVSTMDSSQFNILIQNLEKNSNLIQENLKSKSNTDSNSKGEVVKIQQHSVEKDSKIDNDKMFKLMEKLNNNMGVMVSALNNISSILIENRNISTTLRPHKHN